MDVFATDMAPGAWIPLVALGLLGWVLYVRSNERLRDEIRQRQTRERYDKGQAHWERRATQEVARDARPWPQVWVDEQLARYHDKDPIWPGGPHMDDYVNPTWRRSADPS